MQAQKLSLSNDRYSRCKSCLHAFRHLLNQQYSGSDDGVDRTSETQISLDRLRRTRVVLHPSFAALRKSAEQGCPLCRRLNQPLLSQTSSRRYKIDPDGVVYLERVWENFKPNDRYCRSHIAIPGLGQSFLSLLDEPSWLADFPTDYWQQNDQWWLHARKESMSNAAPLATVTQWLKECKAGHEDCRGSPSPINQFMPTRLLEVRKLGSEVKVRLMLSSAMDDSVPYVTLSYMWGKENAWGGKIKHVTTTKENYDAYRDDIDYSRLPRTFRDTIWLTLKLGFSHVWIDALCIIQPSNGDTTDWDVEASKMRDVYAYSALTVAAASAATVHDGLYMSPEDLKFRAEPCRVDDLFNHDHWLSEGKPHHHEIWINPRDRLWEDSVIDSPLSSRGWVLQERLFSRRIVFMAQECIFWQCQQLQASEQKPLGINEASAWDVTLRAIESDNFSLERWYSLLRVYSYKSLTEMKDKLSAFAGIAKSFGDAGAGTYLAGLWDTDLTRGLLWWTDVSEYEWESNNFATQRIDGPPSWSWASVPTQATYDEPIEDSLSGDTKFSSSVDVQKTTVNSFGPDAYGRINGGSLTLSGEIVLFKQRKFDPSEVNSVVNKMGLTGPDGSKAVLYFDELRFLNQDTIFTEPDQQLRCLLIGETMGDNALERSRRYYLAIENDMVNNRNTYRRLGLVVQLISSTHKRKRKPQQQQQHHYHHHRHSNTQAQIVLI